jgi:ferredoxin
MAKLIIEKKIYQLVDGSSLVPSCREAGIPFNCHTGVCGSCLVRVLDGAENLTPLTMPEIDLGLDQSRRLACQCRIEKGTVTITF